MTAVLPTDFDQLIRERLDDQIAWYDRKATFNQHRYRISTVIQIAISAIIMIVASAAKPLTIPLGTFDLGWAALLAALLAVMKGMETAYQWQANWVNYRGAAESLKRERYLYLGKAGPYADAPDPNRLLVERVEDVIAHETGGWAGRMQQAQPAVGGVPPKTEVKP